MSPTRLMARPRLTIGIPHLDRTDHLKEAIRSCLDQTVPVHIIVADQGGCRETKMWMTRYKDHPNVDHIRTDATCIEENWRAAAKACKTEFFGWLQDDDIIYEATAFRVQLGFDTFPEALHWQATCHISYDKVHVLRRAFTCPDVGLNMRYMVPEMFEGNLLIGTMFFISWALSPGVFFRCGSAFDSMLDRMPLDADLYTERLRLAQMGSMGRWIADPMTAGTWHHHGGNASNEQNTNGTIDHQTDVMVQHLDKIIDRVPTAMEGMVTWLGMHDPREIVSWMKVVSEDPKHPVRRSRHCAAIQEAMAMSLRGRVDVGEAQDSEPIAAGQDLVWTS